MFNINDKNFLQCVLENEKQHFLRNYVDNINDTMDTENFKDGNVLLQIPINKQNMSDLISEYTFTTDTEEEKLHRFQTIDLIRNVTESVINIPTNADFTTCINIVNDYKQAASKHFYGALLRDVSNPDVIINPLHILATLSILESEDYLKHRKFDVIIYVYADRRHLNRELCTHMADLEAIEANINALTVAYSTNCMGEFRVVNTNSRGSDSYQIDYQMSKSEDESEDCTHYLSAHQVVTKSILAPYYGTSLIECRQSTSKGLHLTPFNSCNINDYDEKRFDEAPEYHSVCTGDLPNYTTEGLRTLTHSNLDSAHNSYNLQHGCLAYADMMINKTLDLYTKAGLITAKEPKKEEENHAEKEQKENPNDNSDDNACN